MTKLKAETNDDSTALALLQEIAKDRRTQLLQNRSADDSATPKQLALLDRLNVDHAADISKAEASRLITSALSERVGAEQVVR